MKKTFIMLAAAALMLATPSCKKGENDPFLSLSSRKSRVAGDWEMSDFTFTSKNTQTNGDYQDVSRVYANGVITETNTNYDAASSVTTSTTSTITIDKATYTFGKDGTWSRVYNTTTVNVNAVAGFTTTTTTVETSNSSGTWSFVGKAKGQFKNKERMLMDVLTSTSTDQTTSVTVDDAGIIPTITNEGDTDSNTSNYSNGQNQQTWDIDQLKGKEMIVKSTNEWGGTWSVTTPGGTATTGPYDTYTSTETTTLSIVK